MNELQLQENWATRCYLLTFTHFCFVTSILRYTLCTILLFAGRTALRYEGQRDYPVVIPIDKNVGSGETDAQVKIVI